jgi:hypothetical protein
LSAVLNLLRSLVLAGLAFFRTRRQLAVEILALRHQLGVLKRSVKRSRLTNADRGLWVLLSRRWAGWSDALIIVKPATVVVRVRAMGSVPGHPCCRSRHLGLLVPVVRHRGFLQGFRLRLPVHAALTRFAADGSDAVHASHDSARLVASRSSRATFLVAASSAGMFSACPKYTSSGVRPLRAL